jgi:hypothetical protein
MAIMKRTVGFANNMGFFNCLEIRNFLHVGTSTFLTFSIIVERKSIKK